MKILLKTIKKLSLVMLLALSANTSFAEETATTKVEDTNNDIIIAGGAPFGLRYAQAGQLCNYVNKSGNLKGDCTVYAGNNSADAIEALQTGRANFAMVQSDWLIHAKDGTSRYSGNGADETIRVVATLNYESVVIVVNKDSGIKTLSDLKNHKIDIGKTDTYRNIVSLGLLEVAGLSEGDLKTSLNGTQDEAINAVCKGNADGAVFILANPNSFVDMMSAQCNISFVTMTIDEVKKFTKDYKGFYETTIPNETYWSQESDINTVGIYTVLITTVDTDKSQVQLLKDGLVGNIENFSSKHPMLRTLNTDNINTDIGVKYYNFD